MFIGRALILSALATISLAGISQAGQLYFQGFETDTSGWYPETGGSPAGSISQVPSGGGSLGLTAPDGNYYAEVTNSPNAYQTGYGNGGYSLFGYSSAPSYPGSPFTQSIDVYVDASLTMDSGVQDAFWIDDTPSSTDPYDVANDGGFGYGAEHNFRLDYTGSNVAITVDGNLLPLYTVATSGWYDFEFTYSPSDSNPTDTSNTTMTIATPAGNVLATQTFANNSDSETLQNQYLAGPGYTWLPVWANGFSNDTLGIDDVQAFTSSTPEPASFVLFSGGLVALGFAAWRKRHYGRS